MVKMQCKIVLVLAALLGCFMMGSVRAFTHIVGGRYGWRVPVNLTFFDEWAKPRTFGVGDKLVFPSRPCGNNVVWVTKDDYEHCTQHNIICTFYEGPLVLNLTQIGDYYFYSGVGKHCEAGHKLHITVGNKEGYSGNDHPFKLFDSEHGASLADSTLNAATPATATAASSRPQGGKHSSATAMRSIGTVSTTTLLLTYYFFLCLFI
ncbi:umecyanin-like [Humulus lupulus]|uniref:umecyanin-like n=1 Tax=Humulus lupulus TaxID=3486 RepID=UPI002B413D81|nr:umecyanin-like [Humulus lupulus]